MSSVGGAVAAEPAEREAKRRRLLNAGGPVEDDETARQKMRDARVGENYFEITGFDPDNLEETRGFHGDSSNRMTPMGYFALNGDLSMTRWLYVNGAGVRDLNVTYYTYFPMYAAATGLHYEVVKWLYTHGAAKDATRLGIGDPWSPFTNLFINGERSLIQWLVLNSVFCQDDNGTT